jgi:hypothetical protein
MVSTTTSTSTSTHQSQSQTQTQSQSNVQSDGAAKEMTSLSVEEVAKVRWAFGVVLP